VRAPADEIRHARQSMLPDSRSLHVPRILELVPTDDDDVFVMYEYELTTGQRHRNVELMTVRDGRITETQVFFGGRA
jgi:hypothetical protein